MIFARCFLGGHRTSLQRKAFPFFSGWMIDWRFVKRRYLELFPFFEISIIWHQNRSLPHPPLLPMPFGTSQVVTSGLTSCIVRYSSTAVLLVPCQNGQPLYVRPVLVSPRAFQCPPAGHLPGERRSDDGASPLSNKLRSQNGASSWSRGSLLDIVHFWITT